MKTGRTATPAPASKEAPIIEAAVQHDFSAANQLAVITRETETRVRAVAMSLGYQLPADCTDPDLIQRDISANMRRSVEACLQVGMGLHVLKTACQHGDFIHRLDVLGIEARVAQKFMQSARKFGKAPTSALLTAVGTQNRLFEMLVLDDEQIEELELTGQTGELSLDDVATMSVKELRAALREAREEKGAVEKVLSDKNTANDKLRAQLKRIQAAPADEQLLALQREATSIMNDALGAIRGQMRQALIALKNHGEDNNSLFAAGLVGQLQGDLTALREEFQLPDVSTAADAQLAAEVAEWAGQD